MRHLVNSRTFLMRKALDGFLHTFFPNSWTPLYSMVSFTRVRYHLAIAHKQRQDKVRHRAQTSCNLTHRGGMRDRTRTV